MTLFGSLLIKLMLLAKVTLGVDGFNDNESVKDFADFDEKVWLGLTRLMK